MPTFGAWEATVLEHAYEHVDYISRAHLLRPVRRRPGQLPAPRPSTWTASSPRSSRPPTTSAAKQRQQAQAQALVRRVERLVPVPPPGRPGPARLGRGAGADRGRLHRRRRGGRRRPADHPAPARRPGRRRLPGPAGQRDRPDPHRARRPGLAADHLPPVRADRPVRPGHRAAHRARVAALRRPTKYGDGAALSTPSPCTTRRPAS